MPPQQIEWTWLDAGDTVSLSELSRACGLSAGELAELVDYGALVPLDANRHERVFSAECVMRLRTVGKLRMDFDLDVFAAAMLMEYLGRIEALEREVRALQAAMAPQA